jgi:PIN domain nuclease of toxin-antitoxin system
MRLLIDTHVFIWASDTPSKLTAKTRALIAEPANDVFVSAASLWEMAIKAAMGRLRFPVDRMPEIIAEMGFEPLSMTMSHALEAGSLPRHHDDPFDRMLIAQARLDGLTLVTLDRQFARYDVPIFKG